MGFDLLSRPWLPVIDLRGDEYELGLRELLTHAHELRRLVGETPTMTAALHRLVLAFAHSAYGPATEADWNRLWTDPTLPAPEVPHEDRFDLFHPNRPFLQCPALSVKEPGPVTKLVMYRASGNNRTLFDHTTAGQRTSLDPADAARWLVTVQAYDAGGLKTPFTKVKSSKAALGNQYGCVLVEGPTLKETLLLNLLVYAPKNEEPRGTREDDRPAWDGEPPDPEPEERHAKGWLDVLTWPSRRVLLHRSDDDRVDGVVISPGAQLRTERAKVPDLSLVEHMAAYGKAKNTTSYQPVRLDDRRGVWRHARDLLLGDQENGERLRPRALDQIADMLVIPSDTVYTLRVFGQQLNRQGGAVTYWREEAVAAPVALMRATVDEMVDTVLYRAVTLADEAGLALRNLERGFLKEAASPIAGAEIDLPYWSQLVKPFDGFLLSLAEEIEAERPVLSALTWCDTVTRICQGAGRRWAYGAPRHGRDLELAAKHYSWFRRALGRHERDFRDGLRRALPPEMQPPENPEDKDI